MTGFGSKEGNIPPFGKIYVKIKSSNHKFLDTILHVPEGFLSLEDKIKKEIESRITRGRVTCVIDVIGGNAPGVFINKPLLKKYISVLESMKEQFDIKDEISLDIIIRLPGILSLSENRTPEDNIWPHVKILVNQATDDLVKMRKKEGHALYMYLKNRAIKLEDYLVIIKKKFKKVIKTRCGKMKTDEERSSFLKDTDIAEEIERLTFHIRSFRSKLSKGGSIGKELDFVAQEMHREANTIGAKSCNVAISARIVQIKSQIEKIREQVQNIE
jgi:uncharacterized protein (TIGR00255 family)